jgi:CarD family transcriptional regulator
MMSFKVGDRVVHPAHGVGNVVMLEEKKFSGKKRLYYKVDAENCTVWVPVDDSDKLGLRPLTKKANLDHYKEILMEPPETLSEDHRSRQSEISKKLKDGSFKLVCEVVRDLTALSWQDDLNNTDSNYLRKGFDALCQEWAASSGVSIAKATREINQMLRRSRDMYWVEPAVAD